MISERVGKKLDTTFDQLNINVKHKLFQEIKDLGLRIAYRSDSWGRYMFRKSRSTQGKLSKLYALLAEFEEEDVNVFLNAFSETNEPLSSEKKRTVIAMENINDTI